MTIYFVEKQIKKLKSIVSEYYMLKALIKGMEQDKKKGLKPPEGYLNNAKRRKQDLLKEFENILK